MSSENILHTVKKKFSYFVRTNTRRYFPTAEQIQFGRESLKEYSGIKSKRTILSAKRRRGKESRVFFAIVFSIFETRRFDYVACNAV